MRRFLIAYLLLLGASWAVRWGTGALDGEAIAERHAADAVAAGAELVETRGGAMAVDVRPGAGDDGPDVLLLHGSPGSRHDFDALIPALPEEWTLYAPDLPGFGDSRFPVDDYSIAAHAGDALAVLDRYGVERAHVVGFSMGSGVMLELLRADAGAGRARSALLAGIGVQEMELFGSYELNHLVHAGQLAVFSISAVRGCRTSGCSTTRCSTARTRRTSCTPTSARCAACSRRPGCRRLIVHGERDFLVPAAAAREHHRILPQSELVMLDGSHFLPWTHTEARALDELTSTSWRAVEAGTRAHPRNRRRRRASRPPREPFDPRRPAALRRPDAAGRDPAADLRDLRLRGPDLHRDRPARRARAG